MHLHILGICGTFMAGIAAIARQQGHRVTGSDENAWPPMSDQLAAQGIEVLRGYDRGHLVPAPDLVIVGNAMTRGNPAVEHLLDNRLPYVSGPDWLARSVLRRRAGCWRSRAHMARPRPRRCSPGCWSRPGCGQAS